MAMRSAGDLVIYGIGAPEGHVSYIDEVGAHAGPSQEELHTFVAAPEAAGLPARIDHPRELYDVFVRYQPMERPPIVRSSGRHPVAATTWQRHGGSRDSRVTRASPT